MDATTSRLAASRRLRIVQPNHRCVNSNYLRRHGLFKSSLLRLTRAVDIALRQAYGIFEFCQHADCILRLEKTRARVGAILPDGAHIYAGDWILELHLWNEHLCCFQAQQCPGSALFFRRKLTQSLKLLAGYLATTPALRHMGALHARLALERGQDIARYVAVVRYLGSP
jgi:hypothetical protein